MDVCLRDQFVSCTCYDLIRKQLIKNDTISFFDPLKRATDLKRIVIDRKVGIGEEKSVSQVGRSSCEAAEGQGGNRHQQGAAKQKLAHNFHRSLGAAGKGSELPKRSIEPVAQWRNVFGDKQRRILYVR